MNIAVSKPQVNHFWRMTRDDTLLIKIFVLAHDGEVVIRRVFPDIGIDILLHPQKQHVRDFGKLGGKHCDQMPR